MTNQKNSNCEYAVFKSSDLIKYLSLEELKTMRALSGKVDAGRHLDGKNPFQYKIIEPDIEDPPFYS